MKLYSLIMGNQKALQDLFTVTNDGEGNLFIGKADIRQNIRVDKEISIPEGNLPILLQTASTKVFQLPEGVKWKNNYRSFNPVLVKYDQENTIKPKKSGKGGVKIPEFKGEPKKDSDLVFITIMNKNYRILSYELNENVEILQTFHGNVQEKEHQGCVMVVPPLEEKTILITIQVDDLKAGDVKKITVSLNEKDHLEIQKKSVEKGEKRDAAKGKAAKTKNLRTLGFKIHPSAGKLLTATYVVSQKYQAAIEKATAKIKNKNIIVIPDDKISDMEYIKEAFAAAKGRLNIRAITTCGVDIDTATIKEMRIIYLFTYDLKNRSIACKRSN